MSLRNYFKKQDILKTEKTEVTLSQRHFKYTKVTYGKVYQRKKFKHKIDSNFNPVEVLTFLLKTHFLEHLDCPD